MHRSILFLFLLSFAILTGPCIAGAATLVSENFDDRNYVSPLTFYNLGSNTNIIYDSANARGGTGNALKFDHSLGYLAGIGILSNFHNYVTDGVYIRYWVKYDSKYLFPGDIGAFDNLKLFKLAGNSGYDIEFIYKGTGGGGPSSLQLFWNKSDGSLGGTSTGNTSIGTTVTKGVWHKIEIYLKLASPSKVHVQIDDHEVYKDDNADIRLPASLYTGTQQFMSIRASTGTPPNGNGFFYTDDITIVHNQGDLCSNEPPEPSAAGNPPPPPPTIEAIEFK